MNTEMFQTIFYITGTILSVACAIGAGTICFTTIKLSKAEHALEVEKVELRKAELRLRQRKDRDRDGDNVITPIDSEL